MLKNKFAADPLINPFDELAINSYFNELGIYCKGGGGSSIDKAYNARMASIAERQQDIADAQYQYWQEKYRPMEEAQIEANIEIIPYEIAANKEKLEAEAELIPERAGLERARIETSLGLLPYEEAMQRAKYEAEARLIPERASYERSHLANLLQREGSENTILGEQAKSALRLIPAQTDFEIARMNDQLGIMEERRPIRKAFYQYALEGTDPQSQADRAAADAAQAFVNSSAALARDAAKYGINPNSGRFAAMNTSNAIQRAQAIGGARSKGWTQGEQERFARLQAAMQMGGIG